MAQSSPYYNDSGVHEYGNLPRDWQNGVNNGSYDTNNEGVTPQPIYANLSAEGSSDLREHQINARIESDREIYLSPNNIPREIVDQRVPTTRPSPRSRRKKARSRYDEDNYALPDLPQDSSPHDSSQEVVAPDSSKLHITEFCRSRWKMYLIILVALVIALGGGLAAALVFLRKKGNLIFLLNWTSEYSYHIAVSKLIFDILSNVFIGILM